MSELDFTISSHKGDVMVILGRPVHFLYLTPEQARDFAQKLVAEADKAVPLIPSQ